MNIGLGLKVCAPAIPATQVTRKKVEPRHKPWGTRSCTDHIDSDPRSSQCRFRLACISIIAIHANLPHIDGDRRTRFPFASSLNSRSCNWGLCLESFELDIQKANHPYPSDASYNVSGAVIDHIDVIEQPATSQSALCQAWREPLLRKSVTRGSFTAAPMTNLQR
jgi:hypothetical protein